MIKITKTKEKLTPAKQNIQLDGIYVKDLKFVDETGDITQQVIEALPERNRLDLKSLWNYHRTPKKNRE